MCQVVVLSIYTDLSKYHPDNSSSVSTGYRFLTKLCTDQSARAELQITMNSVAKLQCVGLAQYMFLPGVDVNIRDFPGLSSL